MLRRLGVICRCFAIAAGLTLAAGSGPALADTISYTDIFSAFGQSVWAEGNAATPDTGTRRFGPDPFSAGKQVGDVSCGILGCYGAKIGATVDGDVGLNYGVKLNSGSLDVNYPVIASFSFPAPNAVTAFSPFTISSSFQPVGGGLLYLVSNGSGGFLTSATPNPTLQVHSPDFQTFVDLHANVSAFIGAEACFAGCIGPSISPGFNGSQNNLIAINRDGNHQVTIAGSTVSLNQNVSALGGLLNAQVNIPNLNASGSAPSAGYTGTIQTDQRGNLAALNANVAQIAVNAAGVPVPLSANVSGIGYNLLQANAGLTLDVQQILNFVPRPTVTLNFSTPVEQLLPNGAYGAFNPDGSYVPGGTSSSVTFKLGDSISLIAPHTLGLAVVPTITLDNTTSNSTNLVVGGDFNLKALGANAFGLTIGPLVDTGLVSGDIGTIGLYNNSFGVTFGQISEAPFNIQFNGNTVICSIAGACSDDFFGVVPGNTAANPTTCFNLTNFNCYVQSGADFRTGLLAPETIFNNCTSFVDTPIPNCHAIEGTTSPLAFDSQGNEIFLSDSGALGLTPVSTVAGSTDASDQALLGSLGFSDTPPAFDIPLGNPPLSSPVPEPSTLWLLGFAVAAGAVTSLARRFRCH
jgi:hypothetical protein